MRLSLDKRSRCVEIYHLRKLHLKKNKFSQLKLLVNSEDIEISTIGLRNLIEKYNETNSVKDIVSISRGIGHCKVINSQLNPHYVDFNAFNNYRQLYCFIIFFYQISQTNCTYLNIFTIN